MVKWPVLVLLGGIFALTVFLAGCTAPSQTNASVAQGLTTAQTTTTTAVATSPPTTVTTVPVTTTASPESSPTPTQTESSHLVTAEEAEKSAGNMVESFKSAPGAVGQYPDDAKVGKAVLITKDGKKVYEVPVLADGRKIDTIYVDQEKTITPSGSKINMTT